MGRLEKRTGANHVEMPISYDIDAVSQEYQVLSSFLGEDFSEEIEKDRILCEAAIHSAKEEVADVPVFVSDSATVFPLSLAVALLKYGFHVTRVYLSEVVGPDQKYADILLSDYPHVKIIQGDHPDSVFRSETETIALAVGEEAAYLSHACYVADISSDEGLFGYQGIRILMDTMRLAMKEKADIRKLIDEYGGIV